MSAPRSANSGGGSPPGWSVWRLAAVLAGAVVYVAHGGSQTGLAPVVDGVGAAVFGGWAVWNARRAGRGAGRGGDGAGPAHSMSAAGGMAAVVGGFFAARALGVAGFAGWPVVYLSVTVVVALQGTWQAVGTLAAAGALVWAPWLAGWDAGAELGPVVEGDEQMHLARLALRTGLLGAFGAFGHFVHGRFLWEASRRREREARRHREQMLEEAREYRLLNAGRSEGIDGDRGDYAVIDAVKEVRQGIWERLSLLKSALRAHTCVLLWFDVGGDRLKIRELASDSDAVVEGELDPAKGVIGSIGRCREPVHLTDMRHGSRGLTYYRSREPITQFLGVPLLEDGHIRGILCVDRLDGAPFDDDEQRVVGEVGDSILRTIQNERLFRSVEETKSELGEFFKASKRLNSVLTLQDVQRMALRSASDVVDCEFAAVTLCEEDEEGDVVHRIAAVRADDALDGRADGWEGVRFAPNSGLVSMAVKNEHYLPYGGRLRDGDTVVFTRQQDLDVLESLLVIPLIARDEPIGTLVMGRRAEGGFGPEQRDMLEVIANQVAVSLQNARLYARMEELATTDELTGLANRRTFEEKLEEASARHRRAERSFGVVLLDIDHFKAVNDTYGHAVGDEVLERVAAVLEDSVREIDTAARWGGEEFIILLEETELDEAKVAAERVRRNVAALEFRSGVETFGCTVSLGVACWPNDASGCEQLVEHADDALYASKDAGRDQVSAWRETA